MEAKNPYRTNEFCVNWEDNLLATSMGDAYEVGKQAGQREVVEWIDENIWFVAKTEPQSAWQSFKKERGL